MKAIHAACLDGRINASIVVSFVTQLLIQHHRAPSSLSALTRCTALAPGLPGGCE
jgi:hypothetical protein